jgi:hypothetical protein
MCKSRPLAVVNYVVVVVVIHKAPSSRARHGLHVVSYYVKFALSITPCVYIKIGCSQADGLTMYTNVKMIK